MLKNKFFHYINHPFIKDSNPSIAQAFSLVENKIFEIASSDLIYPFYIVKYRIIVLYFRVKMHIIFLNIRIKIIIVKNEKKNVKKHQVF